MWTCTGMTQYQICGWAVFYRNCNKFMKFFHQIHKKFGKNKKIPQKSQNSVKIHENSVKISKFPKKSPHSIKIHEILVKIAKFRWSEPPGLLYTWNHISSRRKAQMDKRTNGQTGKWMLPSGIISLLHD